MISQWGWIRSECYFVVPGRHSSLPCCALLFRGTPVTGHQQLGLIFLVCIEHGYQIADILEVVSVIDLGLH